MTFSMLDTSFTLKQALAATEVIAHNVSGEVEIQVDKKELVLHGDILRFLFFIDRQKHIFYVELNRIEDNIIIRGRFTDKEADELIETEFQSDSSVLTDTQLSAINECSKDILKRHLASLNELFDCCNARLIHAIESLDNKKIELLRLEEEYAIADESRKAKINWQIKNKTQSYELLYNSINHWPGRIAELNEAIDIANAHLSELN